MPNGCQMKFLGLPALLLTLFLLTACSFQQLALNQTAALMKGALPTFEQETDFELAAEAMPATIKTTEGFLQNKPDHPQLLQLTAQAYLSYALIVLEDQWDQLEEESPQAQQLAARIREMYLRAHRYGLRLLETRHPGFHQIFDRGGEALEHQVASCGRDDVPGLFWSGMSLAAAINFARDDVQMIALMPKVKILMQRSLQLDETYYYGGGHMVFGMLYGSVGKMLGGDPDKARYHFNRALTLTQRRFLLVQYYYAKTLAVQLQDQKLFMSLLHEIQSAPLDILPAQKLANLSAKRRTRWLQRRTAELF